MRVTAGCFLSSRRSLKTEEALLNIERGEEILCRGVEPLVGEVSGGTSNPSLRPPLLTFDGTYLSFYEVVTGSMGGFLAFLLAGGVKMIDPV
jgi:hypothetical protein